MKTAKTYQAQSNTSLVFIISSLIISACGNINMSMQPQTIPTPTQTLSQTQTIDPPEGGDDFQSYTSENFGLEFHFPEYWYGPDVYEWEDGVRIAVGSDIVYPYGTDRVDQVFHAEDAYYVTIQYEIREDGLMNDTYLDVLDLADGESIETPRSLVTRVREFSHGDFMGIEYTGTLSETAQTEMFYVREVILFGNGMRFITITGSPNNVIVSPAENWRERYRAVDLEYQEIFYGIVNSINLY